MPADPLAAATQKIRELVSRKVRPLGWLEAAFLVSEGMPDDDAKEAFKQLLQQRFLVRPDADLAQMLAARLGVEVQWSHMPLVPGAEWQEGRGQ